MSDSPVVLRDTALPQSGGAVVIREVAVSHDPPLFSHPDWRARFPWLLQAATGRGEDGAFDLSFYGRTPSGSVLEHWRAVRAMTGFPAVIHARQVHGVTLLEHAQSGAGIVIHDDADGHLTQKRGLLLAVSIADCVPISLVDERARAIALLHAGWRGAAAGILTQGVSRVLALTRGSIAELHCHLGPAICGQCYEVGPEVHEALGLPRPERNTTIDLRQVLAEQALALGFAAANVTRSSYCTRCDGSLFFSHRGGARERQMGLLGIRDS